MKLLPLLLYTLRKLPVWIPKSVFKSIHGLVSEFLWQGRVARLKLGVLQQPWKERDLAVPNFYKYFLSGQLVMVNRWLTGPYDDTAVALEVAVVRFSRTQINL